MTHNALLDELQTLFACHTCDLVEHVQGMPLEELAQTLYTAIREHKNYVVHFILSLGFDVHGEWFDNPPLLSAAAFGNLAAAKKMFELGAKINKTSSDGLSPLHLAANQAQLEMVTWLIEQGADVKLLDNRGHTTLHACAATEKGFAPEETIAEIGKLLIDHGVDIKRKNYDALPALHASLMQNWEKLAVLMIQADPSIQEDTDEKGFSPLHCAAFYNLPYCVYLLLKNGVAVDPRDRNFSTPLMFAIQKGSTKIVKELLKHGASVLSKNEDGLSPLHFASIVGDRKILSDLLSQVSEMDPKDEEGRTPLFWAYESEIAKLLVDKGADIFLKDQKNNSLLHIASGWVFVQELGPRGLEAFAIWLIEQGFDLHAKNDYGATPLHIAAGKAGRAASEESERLVKHYLSKGADVNALDQDGATPLHWAASNGNRESCRYLIEAGAPVDLAAKDGFTPLLSASSNAHEKIVLDLLEYDVAVNPSKTENGTPLLDAAKHGWIEVAQKLIEKGADIHLPSMHGKMPHEIAEFFGHTQLAELLRPCKK